MFNIYNENNKNKELQKSEKSKNKELQKSEKSKNKELQQKQQTKGLQLKQQTKGLQLKQQTKGLQLKQQTKGLQQKQQDNIINALKSLELLDTQEDEWVTNSKIRTLPDKQEPTTNINFNKCYWTLLKSNDRMLIYIPTNIDELINCILPFGDKLLNSIHYTYIRNVGGHISFEGNIRNSKFNIHFGTKNSRSKGFWNVSKTLDYLDINKKKFLNSPMAKCMIDSWIDFNGFSPSNESIKTVID